jgi:hypothetical protein
MYICTPCQGQYPAASQLQLPITTIRMGTCYLEPFDRIDIVFKGMRLGEKKVGISDFEFRIFGAGGKPG